MTETIVQKPYNRCLHCPYQEKDCEKCDGPRTSSMPTPRWREFMRDMKKIKGLTFEDISKRCDGFLSAKFIQNTISENAKGDMTRETARLIENAIFGSSSQYPCYLAFEESVQPDARRVKETETEMEKLRENIRLIHDSYKEELERVRAEAQAKIDYLKLENERKDRIIDRLLNK